jgi:hypothetical protein
MEVGQTIRKCVVKTMKVCNADKFECELFDIVLNLNLLKLFQEEICVSLLEVFEERAKEKDSDEKAENVMEKALYLIMQIAFSNFMLVSGVTWVKVLEQMIYYMKENYSPINTRTIGKASCICLCCYIQDPEGIESYLGGRREGLWDCVLDDSNKYSTVAERKVVCILL